MVPQQLMARLLEAIPLQTDLILLGDRYQLSSVEAGSVLADICAASTANLANKELFEVFKKQTTWQPALLTDEEKARRQLSGCLIELKENHRFAKSASWLGRIAALLRDLKDGDDIDLAAREIANIAGKEFEYECECSDSQLKKMVLNKLSRIRLDSGESFMHLKNLASSGNADDRAKAFKLLNSFKILAPGYHDRRGITKLNELCMDMLDLQDSLEPGTPLLILKNDYHLGLFNGDIGLVAVDEQQHKRFFVEGNPQSFSLHDLPEYEVVFAMSVHKSQGSGYDEVLFVMPESSSALMTREMVYTAMTRAKKELRCIGNIEVLAAALKNPTLRMSNLALRLQKK
jgi:exodeoxyribonuclease V alpha subunit